MAEFVGGVIDLDVGADGVCDACERRDGVGRRAAVPVPVDGVGERADDGDGFEFRFVERERVVFVLEQHDGFERDAFGDFVCVVGVPGLGFVVCLIVE